MFGFLKNALICSLLWIMHMEYKSGCHSDQTDSLDLEGAGLDGHSVE